MNTKDDLIWDGDLTYNEQDIYDCDEEQQYKEDCAERADDMNQENRSIWW